MAGEGDETKWVGIRPTNPAETIPVTESTPVTSMDVTEQVPLTDIKVSPLVAGTQFKTLTQKLAPAIFDRSAISGLVCISETVPDVGGSPFEQVCYQVPAGKVFCLEFLQAFCNTASPTVVYFKRVWGANNIIYQVSPYGVAWAYVNWFGAMLFDSNDIVMLDWRGIGVLDDVTFHVMGYLMDKY
jgi:hypothetical protein